MAKDEINVPLALSAFRDPPKKKGYGVFSAFLFSQTGDMDIIMSAFENKAVLVGVDRISAKRYTDC